ncbi:MAG: TonB-dependent receptor [Gammaproteobacteria bacterium]|nr:TonB-dependent receptor [Gammaproteobacteria bacterium]MCY4210594.1 TonB-dependent receptor [Gammaproteobacteria bacterium]MCY4283654.1 TonB-dependent receptor [Gammaproteobacteria bacterium]MCY4339629.1 TonB-dependent receptor [Gammaproteobacteria bacterium]
MLFGAAAFLVVMGSAPYVQAQDGDSSSAFIEEVVVLAQKREQNLQEVPASVAVVTAAEMAAAGVSSGLDVVQLTPAITLYRDQDPRTTNFSIRGLSSAILRSATEPSASIIIDGETLPRASALNMDLTDVERVEVLRGPQGTLFGKNVSAGALHIVTKRPSMDGFSGNINVTVAEDDEYITRGSVNLPLSDTAALRVNAYWRDMGGYITNLDSSEPDGGAKDAWGFRGQFLFEPSENLEILTRLEVAKEDFGPYAKVLTNLPANLTQETIDALELSGDLGNVGPNNRTTSQIGDRDYGDLDNLAISLEGRYDAGAFDVVYVGSYRDWELYTNEDQSLIAVNMVPHYFAGDTNIETIQQELRLESHGDGPVNYTAGLFYNHQEIFRSERWGECIQFTGPTAPNGGLPEGTTVDPNTFDIIDCGGTGRPLLRDDLFHSLFEVDNYAAFVNLEWRVMDSVNLFAGARLLHEKQELTHEVFPSNTRPDGSGEPYAISTAGDAGGTPEFSLDTSDTAVIGRVGGQYFVNDDLMLYASFASGYKGKGWDNLFQARSFIERTSPVDAEKPQQWEVGFKGDFLDGRARANLTLFWTDVKGYQDSLHVPDPTFAGGRIRRLSGTDVLTRGGELELMLVPVESLVLFGSFSYTDATYNEVNYAECSGVSEAEGICEDVEFPTAAGGVEVQRLANRDGQQVPNSVKFSYLLSADYRFDLPGGYNGSTKLTYRWLDDQDFVFKPNLESPSAQHRDSYGTANLALRVVAPEDKWALTFFVNNLFDEEYHERVTIAHVSGYAGGVSKTIPRNYKRYLGANLSVNF